jgi:hypothetical protein
MNIHSVSLQSFDKNWEIEQEEHKKQLKQMEVSSSYFFRYFVFIILSHSLEFLLLFSQVQMVMKCVSRDNIDCFPLVCDL